MLSGMSHLSKDSGGKDPVTQTFQRRTMDMHTVAMTVLYALENLNKGDDSWTKKSVLTIHIFKSLHITVPFMWTSSSNIECQCTYHGYVQEQGAAHTNPAASLAVTFNSGCGDSICHIPLARYNQQYFKFLA
ncbi:hypothetical protein L208DRAFT_1381797 [Tricholoma matsutake]|nr:hypothetical protein L208DRAFT_1381797 [Tricholoma matsutake 945]